MYRCNSEIESRKAQMKARALATENEIIRLKEDSNKAQKALDEGAAIFEDIHLKHQRDVIFQI